MAAAVLAAATSAFGAGDILGQVREHLGPALSASDLLAQPGDEVSLEAGLKTALRVEGIEGKRIQFILGETIIGEARTDAGGAAAVRWKAPAAAGDYRVRIRIHPEDQPSDPIGGAELLVAVRPKETPIVVVDLDHTVVGSGFAWVLLGDAKPMPGAGIVMQRLAAKHTVVYLTHRPDFLGTLSKRWLTDNGFPLGPVLTSSIGTLVAGSGPYKSARLEALKRAFPNLALGIGDKPSDAKVYVEVGMRAILILRVDWTEDEPEKYEKLADELAALPDTVQVVTNWSQIAAICFSGASSPKREMEDRLRQTARDLRKRGRD